jgi:hypothetical protein
MAETQNNDGWIEWKGGKCPVADDVLVNWRVPRNEGQHELFDDEAREAGLLNWINDGDEGDIIAYRIHKD